jgi:hypothetical protein
VANTNNLAALAQEEERKRGAASGKNESGFMKILKKKGTGRVFSAMTRFAENQHFDAIKDRANLRYQVHAALSY